MLILIQCQMANYIIKLTRREAITFHKLVNTHTNICLVYMYEQQVLDTIYSKFI